MSYVLPGIAVVWTLCGVFGYIAMHYCDTAVESGLREGKLFLVNYGLSPFIKALVFGPIALYLGIWGLGEWRKFTHQLLAEINAAEPVPVDLGTLGSIGNGSELLHPIAPAE
jgi:hypothetical protein